MRKACLLSMRPRDTIVEHCCELPLARPDNQRRNGHRTGPRSLKDLRRRLRLVGGQRVATPHLLAEGHPAAQALRGRGSVLGRRYPPHVSVHSPRSAPVVADDRTGGCRRTVRRGSVTHPRLVPEFRVETFAAFGDKIQRQVLMRDGSVSRSVVTQRLDGAEMRDLAAAYDASWLRAETPPESRPSQRSVRVVDLFAGCGGLSAGVREACRAIGATMEPVLAVDMDADALAVYESNFPGVRAVAAPIEEILDSPVGSPLSAAEKRLRDDLGRIDLVIGGPPCQGHSDANNHTRHADPRNELYMVMARFCEVVRPGAVIIENVPGVERDRGRVAERTWQELRRLGYHTDSGLVDASEIGVGQKRRRSITLGSLSIRPSVADACADVGVPERDLRWAIGDLAERLDTSGPFDSAPKPNATNAQRIAYLFDNGLYELPDSQRPDCHRLKRHSYVSVYGRLRWDRPAPTITTGFGTMGRGRYVHPSARRTITPHEAARIQGFPDFFSFGPASRTLLQKLIGNAVPPRMGYAVGLHLLR